MTSVAPPAARRTDRLALPGWNCWRVEQADRFGVLVDAEAYFRALWHTLPQARHSILVLGWEFDSRTDLVRDPAGPDNPCTSDLPHRIGPLLDALVRRRPQLAAHLLIWDSPLIYAFSREFAGVVKMDWLTHRRLRFRLDDSHPLGGSHHQKIVVIDDQLAFLGGLDITSQRWDSRLHDPDDSRRSDSASAAYPPFHDVMAVVSGPAARALGDLCRSRWRAVSGEALPPPPPLGGPVPWPAGVTVLAAPVEVALARTGPAWDGEPAVREVERQFLDMIACARRLLFFENQYLASKRIAEALAARLAEPDGPEVVAIGPGMPHNLMERSTMAVARAELLHRLLEADHAHRFRLYTPVVGDTEVKVHSKVMVVDDRLLRIGSANLNNRSLAFDGECDLTLEALGDPALVAVMRGVRHDLLAEHLGVAPAAVAMAEAQLGGAHAAIAALAKGRRRLACDDGSAPADVLRLITDSGFPDPEEPMEPMVWPVARSIGPVVAALVLLLVAAAAWRTVPGEAWRAVIAWLAWLAAFGARPEAAAAAAAAITLGTLTRLPPALMAFAAALALGPWMASVAALAGGLAGATLHYLLGRFDLLRPAAGATIGAGLARHGLGGMLLMRLLPVAAFAATSLAAGLARMSFACFALGSLMGMAPGIFAMSVLGDRVTAVLRNPSMSNLAVLGLAVLLVLAALAGLAWRLGRACAPRLRP